MDLDLEVEGLDPVRERLEGAIERIDRLQAGARVDADRLFSERFMRERTEFDSFAAFREASPRDADDPAALRDRTGEDLDAFVAETTDFDDWAEMKRTASVADVLDRVGA